MEDMVNKKFWKEKKVLVTGHTGFKGSWLSFWLCQMGAKVYGYSLNPPTKPNLFEAANIENKIEESFIDDIRDIDSLKKVVRKIKPQIVFHLAAQPIVQLSYENPQETYEVNVLGTVNILETLREINSAKSIICITSDKCYENKEGLLPHKESDTLGGDDPYSSSKAACEIVISAYRKSFQMPLASVRAGNVIGGGDWGAYRLLPDLMDSVFNNKPVFLRNPNAVRPWQHVLDPLSGYIVLAEKLYKEKKFASAWNFGSEGDNLTVSEIAEKMLEISGKKMKWTKDSSKYHHETGILRLDISKAKELLNWKPKLNIEKAFRFTVDWHLNFNIKGNVRKIMKKQIEEYLSL